MPGRPGAPAARLASSRRAEPTSSEFKRLMDARRSMPVADSMVEDRMVWVGGRPGRQMANGTTETKSEESEGLTPHSIALHTRVCLRALPRAPRTSPRAAWSHSLCMSGALLDGRRQAGQPPPPPQKNMLTKPTERAPSRSLGDRLRSLRLGHSKRDTKPGDGAQPPKPTDTARKWSRKGAKARHAARAAERSGSAALLPHEAGAYEMGPLLGVGTTARVSQWWCWGG